MYDVFVASFLDNELETHSPSERGLSVEFRVLVVVAPFVTPVELVRGGIADGMANESGNITATVGPNVFRYGNSLESQGRPLSGKERPVGQEGGQCQPRRVSVDTVEAESP